MQANQKISLIEYAAFFGSVQIFKYLYLNGVRLNENMCLYAVHGNHPEIFQIIEEKVKISSSTYEKCFKEAIICFNNDFANYFLSNYLNSGYEDSSSI